MSRADFDEFVKRKHANETSEAKFDPKEELAEWLAFLDQLYKTIESFLASYKASEMVRIEFRPISLNEEFSGPYEAKKMLLHIANAVVTFEPIGTMLIGSKGRVDVQGPRGTARLSLVDKNVSGARQLISVSINGESPLSTKPKSSQIDWVWKIITPPPEIRFLDLTEDSFFDMILGVADA